MQGPSATGDARRALQPPEYEAILRATMDGFWVVDSEGRFLDVNDGYCRLVGYSRDEMLAMRISDIEAAEQPGETARHIQRVFTTGTDRFETRHKCRDGRIVDMDISVNYVPGDAGRLFVFARDITARKLAERRIEFLAGVVEQVGDGVAIAGLDGTLTYLNKAFATMHGYTPDEVAGRHLRVFHTDEQMEHDIAPFIAEVQCSGYARRDIGHRRKDGTLFMTDMSATLLRDSAGAPEGMTAILRDITERKRQEEALRSQAARLEAANRELESFSYSVSHDLRTPLRAIDGFSRILLEEHGAELDGEGRRLLSVVRDSTLKMSRLIDDILAYSRAGRTELAETEVDLGELARQAWADLQPALAGRKAELEIRPLPTVRGDRSMLRQVLSNLLDNAAKFTRPRETARIEIGGARTGPEVVFHVRDNGVGFDMRFAGKLFGVFQRLHGEDEFEGTGIGLAIVKRLVERHGGRVWADGRVGEGANFHFAFPVRRQES